MTAPRLLFLTLLGLATTWLTGCGSMSLFGDKASGSPASLGASVRVPLGGGSDPGSGQGPHGGN